MADTFIVLAVPTSVGSRGASSADLSGKDKSFTVDPVNFVDGDIYAIDGSMDNTSWGEIGRVQGADRDSLVTMNSNFRYLSVRCVALGTTGGVRTVNAGLTTAGGGTSIGSSNLTNAVDGAGAGAVPFYIVASFADAATNSQDIVMTRKGEFLNASVQKRGGAGGALNTLQVLKGATAITNAIDTNIADQALTGTQSIDDSSSTLDAGDTLRITNTKAAGNSALLVICQFLPRA